MPSKTSSDDGLHNLPPVDETVDYDIGPSAENERVPRPATVGRYVVLDLLGMGGMGVVCTAYDPKLERKVALKLLRDNRTERVSPAAQARLLREAQSLAKLSHPNVITVHDVDTFEGQVYIAMEYVEGQTLKEWLRETRRRWREIVDVFVRSGRGLAAAHSAGITHRDFKPANVLIGNDGRVRVLDFGLAKTEGEHESDLKSDTSSHGDARILEILRSTSDMTLTRAGGSVGTPAYMAPEQHLGLPVAAPADQFSFCVSLWEALYGALPYGGDTPEEAFQNLVDGKVREPGRDAQVPAWLHKIVLRGLRPHPADRFPSMQVLLAALGADPAKRRRRRLSIVLGGAALVGSAFGVAHIQSSRVELCQSAEQGLDGVWDAASKQLVQAAFLATDKPYAADTWDRVAGRLDAHAIQWIDVHTRVCEATHVRGEQSEALLDVRMACIQRRRSELGALVDVFSEADGGVVLQAVSATRSLEPLEPCMSAEPDAGANRLPADPDARAAIEAAESKLLGIKALYSAGKFEVAREKAVALAPEIEALSHLPTYARALMLLGDAQLESGDAKAAEQTLHELALVAAEAGVPELEAHAWITLVSAVGFRQRHVERGRAWAHPARAALRRFEDRAVLEAKLTRNLANIDLSAGRFAEAAAGYELAFKEFEEHLGEDDSRTVSTLKNLASARARQGQLDEAKKHLLRGVEIMAKTHGPRHPDVSGFLQNLGNVMNQLGQMSEARAYYERALSIRIAALEPDHPKTADTLVSLGIVARHEGDFDGALEHYERALGVFLRAYSDDHPKVVLVRNNLGKLFERREEYDKAEEHYRQALESGQKRLGSDHPRVVAACRHLCSVLTLRKQPEQALEYCEHAVAGYRKIHGDASSNGATALEGLAQARAALGQRAEAIRLFEQALEMHDVAKSTEVAAASTKLQLARILWRDRSARAEALRLANDARTAYATSDQPRKLATVEAWLASHKM